MSRILILDDEERLRSLMARLLGLEGFEVLEAPDARTAWKRLEQQAVDVILCDVKLPDGHGVELTRQFREKYPQTEVILLTAFGNIPDGVQAIKNGAFDYLTKGDDNERILPLLHRALEKVALQNRIRQLEQRVGEQYRFDRIVGRSAPLRQAISLAEKVAPTPTAVLLTGETGTGKEVFAQAIHQASPRRQKAFVALNCSAFGHDLLENELFGHRAGAFTGALKAKKGLLEEAHEGTLFLDEIGEMPADLQAKLLRVLETGEFIPVGDTKTIRVDIRLLSATNRDLQHEAESGHFRSDLYYRLAVFQIHLPPLRERPQDIAPLAQHFLQWFAAKTNKRIPRMSAPFLQKLETHTWKGNIRELKNTIERAVILCDGDTLETDVLPLELQNAPPSTPGAPLSAFSLAAVEKQHIQKVLRYADGNKTQAAKLLDIGLTTLYRKIEEYGLE